MKTIIIFFVFLLLPFASLAQVDTTNFEFKASGSDGKYTMLTNKVTFLGKAAGEIVTPIVINAQSIDTSKWLFVPIGSDGTYRLIENKESFYGKDSGTVRAQIVSELSSVGTITTSSGICTLNTMSGVITSDNASGSAAWQVIISNSKVTTTSVLIVSVINTAETDTYCSIMNLADGTFTVVARRASGDIFSGEIQITFLIIN